MSQNPRRLYRLIAITIPLGLIINELVSNSFKYAFAGRKTGTITVDLKKANGSYTLVVGGRNELYY